MKKILWDYIAITPVSDEQKTESGLFISGEDAASMRYGNAKVLKVGEQVKSVVDGDSISYDKNNSFKMLIEGKPVIIIRERDVVVVF